MQKSLGTLFLIPVLAGFALAPMARANLINYPAPTGKYAIGTVARHFVDANRIEKDGSHRELMVHFYYPAEKSFWPQTPPFLGNVLPVLDNLKGASALTYWAERLEPYLEYQKTATAAKLLAQLFILPAISLNAAIDATPIANQNFPVVFFSHGLFSSHSFYMAIIEELASHGFIVAAVEHTGSALVVQMPDGAVHFSEKPHTKSLATRVEDIAFVIDQLKQDSRLPIDLERIGIMGHSLGGGTALYASAALPDAIKAAAILDGGLYCKSFAKCSPEPILKQPILALLAATGHGNANWGKGGLFLGGLDKEVIAGVTHEAFLDVSAFRGVPVLENLFGRYLAIATGDEGGKEFSDHIKKRVTDFFVAQLNRPAASENNAIDSELWTENRADCQT